MTLEEMRREVDTAQDPEPIMGWVEVETYPNRIEYTYMKGVFKLMSNCDYDRAVVVGESTLPEEGWDISYVDEGTLL